ncbi:MAG: hypothetical protein ABI690_36135 [Chloroflexota bacterium]
MAKIRHFVAVVAGGKHGKRCQVAIFVARKTAGDTRSATGLA